MPDKRHCSNPSNKRMLFSRTVIVGKHSLNGGKRCLNLVPMERLEQRSLKAA